MRDPEELLTEIERLRAEVVALQREQPAPPGAEPAEQTRSTRRNALRLAGASAAVAVAGAVATARPAAAADPNDVVKNVNNAVAATTTLTGSVSGPLLTLDNNSTGLGARGLLATSGVQDVAAVRGDNSNSVGIGGVGVSGYAPGGRDLFAFGSGRIAMNPHSFDIQNNSYTVGELHHFNGTLYTIVSGNTRRSIAGPATAGALYPIDPVRVYDSRRPQPNPGTIANGQSRIIFVGNARDLSTGAVTVSNAIPTGATAVVFNLTVTGGAAGGYLAIGPGNAATFNSSIINFAKAQTIANASTVKLDAGRQVKIFCSGGPVHFILDVAGYYL